MAAGRRSNIRIIALYLAKLMNDLFMYKRWCNWSALTELAFQASCNICINILTPSIVGDKSFGG